MSLSHTNLFAIAGCTSAFDACKNIETCVVRDIRPNDEVIRSMTIKVANILENSSRSTGVKRIQNMMIINIAVGNCTEKIEQLKQALCEIKSHVSKLVAIQGACVSTTVLELIATTCANINVICDNIRAEMVKTADTRAFYLRARKIVETV